MVAFTKSFFPGLPNLGAQIRCAQNWYSAVQTDLKYPLFYCQPQKGTWFKRTLLMSYLCHQNQKTFYLTSQLSHISLL